MKRFEAMTTKRITTLVFSVGPALLAALSFFPALSSFGAEPTLLKIELYPQKFELRPGERIHYTAIGQTIDGKRLFLEKLQEFTFTTSDSQLLKLEDPTGIFQAVSPGSAHVIVRTKKGRTGRFAIAIVDEEFVALEPRSSGDLPAIQTKTLLSVVHANRDGFDHTGVAKPGIDATIAHAKKHGWPVLYAIDPFYPNWNTRDRNPTHAVATSTGAHEISIDAEKVVFVGGNLYWCLAANVHSTLRETNRQTIELVFARNAIYDGRKGHPYPEAMTRLAELLDQASGRQARYDDVIVPFLKRCLGEEAVYKDADPTEQPRPSSDRLFEDCRVVVDLGDGMPIVYQSGSADRQITFRFVEQIGESLDPK